LSGSPKKRLSNMSSVIGYHLNQSPFYRLSSKRKLAKILGFDFADFASLVDDSNYREFTNKQGRLIQHPIGILAPIHQRIAELLARLELPSYLHSRKGCSYISNAAAHAENVSLIKTDISKFYPSTSFSAIVKMFRCDFECSRDVAWHIARLCSFKGKYLPTGSHLSGIVAFLSHKAMFNEIYTFSIKHGCTMTCYVDDIVISGPKATKTLLNEIHNIIRGHGLVAKPEKSKTFPANKPKIVTGVVITADGLAVPNKLLHKIHQNQELILTTSNSPKRRQLFQSLRGQKQAAKQILDFGNKTQAIIDSHSTKRANNASQVAGCQHERLFTTPTPPTSHPLLP